MPGGAGVGQVRLTEGMTARRDGKRTPGSNPLVRQGPTRSPNVAASAAAWCRVTAAKGVPRAGSDA